MKALIRVPILALVGLMGGNLAVGAEVDTASAEHGKYLVMIAGCNDCHTPAYSINGGQTPEAQWLTGEAFGWHGPWGTTYATNLRLQVRHFTEEQWVVYAKTLKARPPMPWFGLNNMHEADLRSIYRYLVQLGPAGKEAPAYLPPEQKPPAPYAVFP
ncbi:hypothetical protein KDN34_12785 [Shewanella yunxiaonensis]|uniref:Cytochrome c domain-containing protein n=1 Tax=Shewanella yunxiaonensis TaxID=2829809 RepID=A0ABX7YQP0_9GAMM|nr:MULTISPECIES: hypothetical protein [Shewanella]MDF0533902.1 hypothetical protein [Shewanella sp. A32]QUN05083.1 hypothetical protein KDN34_12785 [Shewanella yunxiaonensis]